MHDVRVCAISVNELTKPSHICSFWVILQVLDAVTRWLQHDWDERKSHAWAVLQKVRLGLIPISEVRNTFPKELKEDKNCMAAYCELLEFCAISGSGKGPLLQTLDVWFTPRNTRKVRKLSCTSFHFCHIAYIYQIGVVSCQDLLDVFKPAF